MATLTAFNLDWSLNFVDYRNSPPFSSYKMLLIKISFFYMQTSLLCLLKRFVILSDNGFFPFVNFGYLHSWKIISLWG